MTAVRALPALVAAVGLGWVLAVSSGTSVGWHAADAAELRLSWSARPERIENCRTLSEAEQAARPAHMRRDVECEGVAVSYALTVRVDGDTVDAAVVRGGGLRNDRPIFLLRRHPVAPGARRVQVDFTRREPADPARPTTSGVGDLALDTLITFRAGAVVLVTLGSDALVVRTP